MTICFTPAAVQASIMFHSISISCGIGEQTRKTLVTPLSTGGSVSFLEKSATTAGVPAGALAAAVGERYRARYFSPVFADCWATSPTTAFPTVPLEPVTRIIGSSLGRTPRACGWEWGGLPWQVSYSIGKTEPQLR